MSKLYGGKLLKRDDPLSRFWGYVRWDNGCWVWTGGRDKDGYGIYRVPGVGGRAHVVAYRVMVGPVPDGLVLDHLCRNRPCCNPDHLEPVTSRENTLRGIGPSSANAKKTHCPQGHPYDEHQVVRNGRRYCKRCERLKALARKPTHCPNGHSYQEHAFFAKDGRQMCTPCFVDKAAQMRAARVAKCQPRPCEVCGAIFTGQSERRLTCSDECMKERARQRRRERTT